MAYTPDEQRIYDFIKGALPDWAFTLDGMDEFVGGLVKAVDAARAQRALWLDQAFISTADAGPPDWLNEHAKDRDTRRQSGEDTATLRVRLRRYADAVTRPAILAATQLMLDAAGVVGDAAMLDLRRDRAFFGTFTAQTGTGGTFALVSGTTWKFTPTVPFALPVEVGVERSGSQGSPRIVISGATNGGNNGTFAVTGLSVDGVTYVNATGVAAVDALPTWTLSKRDVEGNVRDGKARSFWGRGYRYGQSRGGFILILPYGTSEALASSVSEMVRQIKAAGFLATVERRTSP